jgi:hypothetical protein
MKPKSNLQIGSAVNITMEEIRYRLLKKLLPENFYWNDDDDWDGMEECAPDAALVNLSGEYGDGFDDAYVLPTQHIWEVLNEAHGDIHGAIEHDGAFKEAYKDGQENE